MWTAHIASNMNFPAPLAVLGFVGAFGGLFVAAAAAFIFWFARKPKFARSVALAATTGAIAYDAGARPDGRYIIRLRTRFDETTTSPNRPKGAPLTPSPRQVSLVDSAGREFAPVIASGTPLQTPLKPAESYVTQLEFILPKDVTGLRLLINTMPAWPDRVVIGDENSILHKKTYFTL